MGTFVEHVREDRFYALWMLAATTGMRRGELAGLLVTDIDFKHARVTPSRPAGFGGRPGLGVRHQDRSRPSRDGARSANRSRAREVRRDLERGATAARPGIARCCSSGPTAHRSTPTRSPRCSTSTSTPPGFPGSGCTTSGTPTPPQLSRRAPRPRSSASGSATPTRPSRCRPTCTSSRAWTQLPPTRWPTLILGEPTNDLDELMDAKWTQEARNEPRNRS